MRSQRVVQDEAQGAVVTPVGTPGDWSPGGSPGGVAAAVAEARCGLRGPTVMIDPGETGSPGHETHDTHRAAGRRANGVAKPAAWRSTERTHTTKPADARLVRRVLLTLHGQPQPGDDHASMARFVTELDDRVVRLRQCSEAYAHVRLSPDIGGLRAASFPDRTGGSG